MYTRDKVRWEDHYEEYQIMILQQQKKRREIAPKENELSLCTLYFAFSWFPEHSTAQQEIAISSRRNIAADCGHTVEQIAPNYQQNKVEVDVGHSSAISQDQCNVDRCGFSLIFSSQ
jgi:hypothetical protein